MFDMIRMKAVSKHEKSEFLMNKCSDKLVLNCTTEI
jgi:hypothetical protein